MKAYLQGYSFAVVALVLLGGTAQGAGIVGCSAEVDAYIWNFNQLRRSPEEGDYILKYKNAADGQVTLNFNMCSNTYNQCHLKNESYFGFDQDFANIVLPNGECHRLTPDDMDDGSASLIDKSNPEYGLRIKFTSNEVCNGTQKYGLIVDIRCEDDAFDALPRLQSDSIKSNSCQPRIYFDSDAGCVGKSFNRIWSFFSSITLQIALSLLSCGLFFTFLGNKFQRITLFISIGLAVFVFSMWLLYGVILPSYIPEWCHALVLFVCVALAVVVGFFTSLWLKFGLFIAGAWLGGTSGMMLYNALIAKLVGHSPHAETIFFVFLAVCVLAAGVASSYVYEHAITLGSAVVGAYFTVRGSGIIIGGFPNEYLVYQEVRNNSQADMPDEFWGYLTIYVLLAIAGFVYQEREFLFKKKQIPEAKNELKQDNEDEEVKPLLEESGKTLE